MRSIRLFFRHQLAVVHSLCPNEIHEASTQSVGVLGGFYSVAFPFTTQTTCKHRFLFAILGPVCLKLMSTDMLAKSLASACKFPAHSACVLAATLGGQYLILDAADVRAWYLVSEVTVA